MISYEEAEQIEKHLGGFETLIELAHDKELHPMLRVEIIETIYRLAGYL